MSNDSQPGSGASAPPPNQPSVPDEVPALLGSSAEESPPELSAGLGASRTPAIVAGVIAFVLLLILVGCGVYLFYHPATAAVLRDIFIILLGIQSIFIGLLMIVAVVAIIYVALKMYDLTQFIENELRPILARVDDTLGTVQSRTTFISDAAVKPVIDVMSYTAAVKSMIRAFTRTQK